MKRILQMFRKLGPGIVLVAFIPNIVFAVWWNPFTWRIFHWFQKETPTQIQEQEFDTTKPLTITSPATISEKSNTESISPVKDVTLAASSSSVEPQAAPQNTSPQASSLKQSSKELPNGSLFDPSELGTVSSALGFSFHYPYKEIGAAWGDDEYFQVLFVFPPSIIATDATTTEQLSSDIHNIRLSGGLSISVIDVTDQNPLDLKSWAEKYLRHEDGSYGNSEIKLLSESVSATTFAGQKGFVFTRSVEGSAGQKSPHYTWKETFVHKGKYVYRIRHLAPSADTVFPRSGNTGKKYLQQVDAVSEAVLRTFSFDNSSRTFVSVPKNLPPKLPTKEQAHRDELLAALRKGPFFDESARYPDPRDPCDDGSSLNSEKSNSSGRLRPSPGLYFTARGVISFDSDGRDYDATDFHVYDEQGNHTGLMPAIPGYPPMYENWVGMIDMRSYGAVRMLSIRENFNGKIELLGKMNSGVNLEINGDGNSCGIAEVYLPTTVSSVATIPLTENGDIGPISLDIDGDGKEDILISLVHPLLPSKQKQLDEVMSLWNTLGHI